MTFPDAARRTVASINRKKFIPDNAGVMPYFVKMGIIRPYLNNTCIRIMIIRFLYLTRFRYAISFDFVDQ
jgi:hypothetical protein